MNDIFIWMWDKKEGNIQQKNEKFHNRYRLISSIHRRDQSIVFLVGEMPTRATSPTTGLFHCELLTSNALICN